MQTEILRTAFNLITCNPIYKHTSSNEVCLRRLRSPNKESPSGATSLHAVFSLLRTSDTVLQLSVRDSDSPLYAEWSLAASGRGNSADAKLSRGLRAPRARWHVTVESPAIFVLTLIPNAQDSSKRHQAYWGLVFRTRPAVMVWPQVSETYINSNTAPQWAMPKHQH